MSSNQSRYVKAELAGVGTYMISMGHFVEGAFEESTFRHAAYQLVQRHEALRTRFEISEGKVHAYVSESSRFQCHVTRLEDDSLSVFREWALPLVFHDVDPVSPGSLIRFLAADYGGRWRFSIAGHHAITDGVSRGILNRELIEVCSGVHQEPAGSYYDYITRSNGAESTSDIAKVVEALPKPVRIVTDAAGDSSTASAGRFVELSFGPLRKRVLEVSKSIGSGKFAFLSAVYALGLRGFTGELGVSTFFQSAGRRSLEAPDTVVGSFSNTLPLNLCVDPDTSFAGFSRALHSQSREVLKLENSALLDEVIAAGKAPSVSINMFPSETPIKSEKYVVGPREFLDRRTEFDLNLVWSEDGESLNARAFYNGAKMTEDRARLFLAFQARLLEAALADPDLECRELLRIARNGHLSVSPTVTREPEPQGRLHEAFFASASQSPRAIAIVASSERITYEDLAARATNVAGGLRAADVPADARVAIFAQRDPATVAAMLGVSAYGASFALIDATYPAARIAHMLDRLETRFVIEAGARLPQGISADMVLCKVGNAHGDASLRHGPPRNEAYHLFTSGTTGKPKLVSHPDQTIQRFVRWQAKTLQLTQPITTMMMAGLAHDPTLRDVFLPLSHGGCIVIPTPSEMMDPRALRILLSDAGCNVLRLSPSTARLLATEKRVEERFPQIKGIFWGGERLPISTVEQWCDFAPDARQFNVFGTTETPQAFLIHEIDASDLVRRDVPVGRTLPWCGVRIIDDDGSPMSDGEVGQIVAELADLVKGVNSDGKGASELAARVHYTGDLGFRNSAGEVFFAGRRDAQIKINGFRVELAEIEATVEALPGIDRAAAVVSENRIYLFVQCDAPDVSKTSIKAHLSRMLPAYMLPAWIDMMPSFPITPNGKVDRDKLMASVSETLDDLNSMPSEAPSGPAEIAVAEVFSRFVARQPGRDDSLLDLGADSLSAIEARFMLERLRFVLPDDWLWMTIRDLANCRRSETKAARPFWFLTEPSRIDTSILLRALAILVVVAFHTGFRVIGGASIVLFALAGYSFARLQLPGILRDGHAGRVWALIVRLLVPMIPMTAVYYALYAYLGQHMHSSVLFFVRNLAELADVLGLYRDGEVTGLGWIWFLHTYLQIFLFVGIALSSSKVRNALRADTWRSLALLFGGSELLGLASIGAVAWIQGSIPQSALLLQTSPTAILPFLVVGALAAVADTTRRRLLTLLFALVQLVMCLTFYVDQAEAWWIAALLICVLIPYVALPRMLSRIVVLIAGFSLMIYLTHNAVFIVLFKVMGGSELARAASIVLQIAAGVALGVLLRPFIRVAEETVTDHSIFSRPTRADL